MQYKKKFINDKILEAGKAEYLEKGFRAGNISTIATNAGVPVGNLYRYFDGKQGLLDAIVKPIYQQLPKTITKLDAETDKQVILDKLVELLSDYGEEILILAECCASTRYEDFTEETIMLMTSITQSRIFSGSDKNNAAMARIIAKAFVHSILDVLKLGLKREGLYEMLKKVLGYYFSR